MTHMSHPALTLAAPANPLSAYTRAAPGDPGFRGGRDGSFAYAVDLWRNFLGRRRASPVDPVVACQALAIVFDLVALGSHRGLARHEQSGERKPHQCRQETTKFDAAGRLKLAVPQLPLRRAMHASGRAEPHDEPFTGREFAGCGTSSPCREALATPVSLYPKYQLHKDWRASYRCNASRHRARCLRASARISVRRRSAGAPGPVPPGTG